MTIILPLQNFIIAITGLTSLVALGVWVGLYELFQEKGGRRVSEVAEPIRYYPVMCGWDVDYSETPPVNKVVVDILHRSWRHLSKAVFRGSFARLQDWYVYAYIILVAIVAAALIMRW